MLYIFLVNTGRMMTVSMNLALESVESLKMAIYEQYQIPVHNQVLLVSGGESLNSSDRVCRYQSSGTDTSPIFLFYTLLVDDPANNTLQAMPEFESDDEMKDRVESCLHMDANFNTVISRAEMAKTLYEADKMIFHACDTLIHEQHLQQQGWAAVVANLQDIMVSFQNKALRVEQLYKELLNNKPAHYELLHSFVKEKEILSRIPLLKSFRAKIPALNGELTVLDWIIRQDTDNFSDENYCFQELELFDEERLNRFKESNNAALLHCNSDMREIKGIETRLFYLERFRLDAKKAFDKQGILTKGFSHNQNRITDLRDPSILPDLCQNHKEQLEMMLQNHLELIKTRHKCFTSKAELCQNIKLRLKWVVSSQDQLVDADQEIRYVGIKTQQFRDRIEFIQKMRFLPQKYLKTIVEVYRRKSFSDSFYKWACSVSEISKQLVSTEINRRREFAAQMEKRILKLIMPGMNDYPQNFTTSIVPIDQQLPQVTLEDIEYLRTLLPDMAEYLEVPSLVPVPSPVVLTANDGPTDDQFDDQSNLLIESKEKGLEDQLESTKTDIVELQTRSINTSLSAIDIAQLESAKTAMELSLDEKSKRIDELKKEINDIECDKQAMHQTIKQRQVDCMQLLKSLRDWKGDTVCDIEQKMNNYGQQFADSVYEINNNLEQWRDRFQNEINDLKLELEHKCKQIDQLKEHNLSLQEELSCKTQQCCLLNEERNKDKGIILSQICEIEKMKEEMETKLNYCKKRQNKFIDLQKCSTQLKSEHQQLKEQIGQLCGNFELEQGIALENLSKSWKEQHEHRIASLKQQLATEKEAEVQKLREQLSIEHKNELESLRHRFKLAISTTSIERTSSETSLEKVQLDIVDQSAQEKEIQKLKNALIEQKAEHEQSMHKLRLECDATIEALNAELEQEKKLNVANDILLKVKKETELTPEQLVQQLKRYETLYSKLVSKVNIDVENVDLKSCQEVLNGVVKELNEVNRTLDTSNFSRSFISIPTSTAESPTQSSEMDMIVSRYNQHLKGIILPKQDDKISITSCEFNDNVLVYYEQKLSNFVVFSLTGNLHFIHTDSLKECDLSKEVPSNEFQWLIAKVMEKEYCQIKKEENRYNLPVNSKFYRVKIKPITKCNRNLMKNQDPVGIMSRSCMPSSSTATSATLISNIMSFFSNSFDSTPMTQSYSNSDSS